MNTPNNAAQKAGQLLAKLTSHYENPQTRDDEKTTLYRALGFLAQSLEELHAKVDELVRKS